MKYGNILAAIAILPIIAGCSKSKEENDLEILKLDKTSISLVIGLHEEESIAVQAIFSDGTIRQIPGKDVLWTSSAPSCFTVTEGVVRAVSTGAGYAKAVYQDRSASASIVVKEEKQPGGQVQFTPIDVAAAIQKNSDLVSEVTKNKTYGIHDGVQVTEFDFTTEDGPLSACFFQVDLNCRPVTIDMTTPDDKPLTGGLQTLTKQFLTIDKPGKKVLGGTNADYFTSSGKPQGIFHHDGACYKNTISTSNPKRKRSFFILTKDKEAYAFPAENYALAASRYAIEEACGGGPVLLQHGQITNAQDDNSGRHPRTALGITKDGKTVFLLVVDGRSSSSAGIDYPSMGVIFKALGCWTAINLDGGGSSEFVVRHTDGFSDPDRFHVLNNPSDGHERKVGPAIALIGTEQASSRTVLPSEAAYRLQNRCN